MKGLEWSEKEDTDTWRWLVATTGEQTGIAGLAKHVQGER